MKFLAITLALAIFAGSLVSIRGDEQRSMLTELRVDVKAYLETVADGVVEQCMSLLSLNASRKLFQEIENDCYKVGEYMNTLHQKLPEPVAGIIDLAIETTTRIKFWISFGFVTGEKRETYAELLENLRRWAEPILEKLQRN